MIKLKPQQIYELEKICAKNKISYQSLQILLSAEKIKKLQRRNHYIQEVINQEIEKALKNENR